MKDPTESREIDEAGPPRHVPAGTWASDAGERRDEPSEHSAGELAEPAPGEFAEPVPGVDAAIPRSETRRPLAEPARDGLRTGSTNRSHGDGATRPPRPPFLASELLRRRDERREPIAPLIGRATAGLAGIVIAAAAATLAALVPGALTAALATSGLLALGLALAALAPLSPAHRPIALLALALPLVLSGVLARSEAAGTLATCSALATNAGLVLRARRHGSWRARALVILGAAIAVAWLLGVGIDGATIARLELDAAMAPTVALTLVVHLALTLLAFVDDHGSSGGGLIACLGLSWSLAEALVAVAPGGLWPLGGAELGTLVAALALPPAAIALAQVFGGAQAPPGPAPRAAAEHVAGDAASAQAAGP